MRVRRQTFSSLFAVLTLCFAMLCVGSTSPAWAQSTSTGTVAGSVADPSGAVVPDATVRLRILRLMLREARPPMTSGRYTFVDVPPGTYKVGGDKAGFSTTKVENQKSRSEPLSRLIWRCRWAARTWWWRCRRLAPSCRP